MPCSRNGRWYRSSISVEGCLSPGWSSARDYARCHTSTFCNVRIYFRLRSGSYCIVYRSCRRSLPRTVGGFSARFVRQGHRLAEDDPPVGLANFVRPHRRSRPGAGFTARDQALWDRLAGFAIGVVLLEGSGKGARGPRRLQSCRVSPDYAGVRTAAQPRSARRIPCRASKPGTGRARFHRRFSQASQATARIGACSVEFQTLTSAVCPSRCW